MKRYFFILISPFFLFSENLELPLSLPPDIPPVISQPLPKKSGFLYSSFSFAPGIGYSHRTRKGSTAQGFDCKVGFTQGLLFSSDIVPIFCFEYDFFHFFHPEKPVPFYFSYGAGFLYCFPYVPIRVGFEHEYWFADIGAKMLLGFIPAPEARCGVRVRF